jgi:hypothetical protein
MRPTTPVLRRWVVALAHILLMAPLATAGGLPQPSDSTAIYTGTERCKECHKHAFAVWVGSDHARAGLMLETARGRAVAHRSEISTNAAARELDCNACHRPPSRTVRARFEPEYHPEDGVQCETCHGPGGEHERIEVAKDTLAGHRIFVPEQNADLCQACHYNEKPLHVPSETGLPLFNHAKWRKRIEHKTPPEGAHQ